MVKPNKKLKKISLILGITGAVYLCFKYLLPLVIPFLLAWGLASILRPSASCIAKKLRVQVKGKYYGIPVGVIGVVELAIALVLLSIGIYFGGQKLCSEAIMLFDQIPVWIDGLDKWLTGTCHNAEILFQLQDNYLVTLTQDMLRSLMSATKAKAMPYLMVNSMTVFKIGIQFVVAMVILMIAVMLSLQEMEKWRKRREASIFQKEFAMIRTRLSIVCNAYIKTQGIIMLLTMTICTVSFFFMGNAYYILAGIGIGLLDALPIFGTGTVLIPWALIMCCQGNTGKGLAILGLYIICYLMRQIMEAKVMGDKVGLSPLETLIAMYVGLQLFGLVGFLLGPIGLLLIEDFVQSIEL